MGEGKLLRVDVCFCTTCASINPRISVYVCVFGCGTEHQSFMVRVVQSALVCLAAVQ